MIFSRSTSSWGRRSERGGAPSHSSWSAWVQIAWRCRLSQRVRPLGAWLRTSEEGRRNTCYTTRLSASHGSFPIASSEARARAVLAGARHRKRANRRLLICKSEKKYILRPRTSQGLFRAVLITVEGALVQIGQIYKKKFAGEIQKTLSTIVKTR